jgi:Uma2 family endonuclease
MRSPLFQDGQMDKTATLHDIIHPIMSTVRTPQPRPKDEEIIGEILPFRWTRASFHHATERGAFPDGARIELIFGNLYTQPPMNRPHAISVSKSEKALTLAFGADYSVFSQLPVALSTDGEPMPDMVVVSGKPDDYADHPTESDVLLIMEISDSTLAFDQGTKSELYAEAGIAEYWILNVRERTLEVRRDPRGTRYLSSRLYEETESVTPLAKLVATVAVADLLPSVG